ncbi:aa3-type cytochrome c oxidase subunit IV [Phenylobacterium sp.]|uniref:aa3-type cytochrome c oxidase subunit IV n=1 Tax=Phenylobacterium sp. TaxID=1871053 RepID=UPI0039836BCC
MADPASDYHRGAMDIREQQATFHLVMGLTKWGSLYLAAALFWLTIWFCTDIGFLGGAAAAVVLVVLGTLLLRDRKTDH